MINILPLIYSINFNFLINNFLNFNNNNAEDKNTKYKKATKRMVNIK
jgi:hypothetical protein